MFNNDSASIIPDFVSLLFKQKDSVWIAHNGSRFHTIFLSRNIMEGKYLVPEIIMNGNKVMKMFIPFFNATFLDSFLFLSMALSKFPECLGFPHMMKGYHPYYFTDLSYRGKMIDLKYFNLSKMNKRERENFDKRYKEKSKTEYEFQDEIYYYCKCDVDILRKGCIIFADLISSVANMLPFYDTSMLTIASVVLKLFKQTFLKKHQLAGWDYFNI